MFYFFLLLGVELFLNSQHKSVFFFSGEPVKKSNDKSKDEDKKCKAQCTFIFIDKKREIDPATPLQLVLSPNGNVRTAGIRISPPLTNEELHKLLLTIIKNNEPNNNLDVTLITPEELSMKVLKLFVDNISVGLPKDKTITFYIMISK